MGSLGIFVFSRQLSGLAGLGSLWTLQLFLIVSLSYQLGLSKLWKVGPSYPRNFQGLSKACELPFLNLVSCLLPEIKEFASNTECSISL